MCFHADPIERRRDIARELSFRWDLTVNPPHGGGAGLIRQSFDNPDGIAATQHQMLAELFQARVQSAQGVGEPPAGSSAEWTFVVGSPMPVVENVEADQ